jgi:dynein heavy chain
MPRLEKSIQDARVRLDFLLENASLTTSDLALNAETLTWLNNIGAIFEEHRKIIRTSREKAEDSLRERRIKFVEEIESYNSQLVEFKDLGNLDEIVKYVKKAEGLQAKLDAGLQRIEEFNSEEEAFEWEISQYPQRNKVVQDLEPYLKLYQTINDFRTNFDKWMDGAFDQVNPEVVENEAGNYWRNLYKLEKTFNDIPAPRIMAANVKREVDDFKENLPLIQALCNPGLRDRHWQKVSYLCNASFFHTFAD